MPETDGGHFWENRWGPFFTVWNGLVPPEWSKIVLLFDLDTEVHHFTLTNTLQRQVSWFGDLLSAVSELQNL